MKINPAFPILMVLLLLNILPVQGFKQKNKQKQSTNPAGKPSIRFTTSPLHPFTVLWHQADSLANIGQPRSALPIVDNIYTQAKAGNNDPQVIKAIIYRIRLNSDFQENFLVKTIASLQQEILTSGTPRKQMLQSILAEVYLQYYQNNQFRFRDRTQVKTNLPDSLETWDLATLSGAITRTYLQSLEQSDTLRGIPVEKYEAVLELEIFNRQGRDTTLAATAKFFPTLYDFLAGRALGYFTSADPMQAASAIRFEVDQPWYFAQTFNFTRNRMMIPTDSSAPASFALRIFRDLATFHAPDKDPRALIDVELKRFAFVHEKYVLPGKDSLYAESLRQFEQAQVSSAWSTSISFSLASYLNGQGLLYQPLVSDLHKWDNRSAVEVCNRAVQRYPESDGAKNCKLLAASVKEPFLMVTTESAVPVNEPSLALVGVKNIKQLYFRLIQTDPEIYTEKGGTLDRPGYFKFLASLPAARSWSQNLPDDGDFQLHRAEIKVPEVPAGFWVLLCTPDKDFNDAKQACAFTPFWSTQISYISKRNADGSSGYFLLDRETGSPLNNVRAESWEKNYNYRDRKYTTVKLGEFTSDDRGYFVIPPVGRDKRTAIQFLKIYHNQDQLITDNFYQYPVYPGQEQTTRQTTFYTDRSIYRPGQTIYFKGIMLERTGDRSKIKPNMSTKVTLTDVNGQKVSEQLFTTNAFGSFNGSFTAPTGVLAGMMTISNESGSTSVSVEEYKRPTFAVSYDPLEGNYRLGESLNVTGKATAFAGNAIDGVQVAYRVVRTARFPFWDLGWRWPMPASAQAEITSGLVTTDAEGKFAFSFNAIPDLNIASKTWPVFDFQVYADVTDLNGETRSAVQTISVGYKSLVIGADLPELVNIAKDTVVKVTSTNLNGQPTKASVKITLQQLRQPEQAFKTRLWDRPDRHLMTQEEFHAQFPNTLFDDENNPESWAAEQTIFEKTIHTDNDSAINILDPGSRLAVPGSYLLTLTATDPFGEKVEVKKYFNAFAPNSKEVPVKEICWFVPLKTSGEPGEKARFLVGTTEENVNMIYEIRMDDSLISRKEIKLSKRAMLIEIPILEQYRGNFSVQFLAVRHNRAFQYSHLVNVPHVSKKLGIVVETFRSKLDPGAKEQWNIRITAPNGKPADAEFLATMYDASLDQFRAHEWAFSLYQRYSGITPWDVDNGFGTASGQWLSQNQNTSGYVEHPGIKLNWFGNNYFFGAGGHPRYSRGSMDKSMRTQVMDMPVANAMQADGVPPPPPPPENSQGNDGNPPQAKTSPPASSGLQVRRDFRETAFFYPSMVTDSAGSLVLQFTAPESLTKWKMLGLAHTKDLDFGLLEKELVTSKDLMVFPNAPRFVRQGDTAVFSTKIVNLSDHDLTGETTLALADGITLKPINNLVDTLRSGGGLNRPFTVKKGESTVASWTLFIPVDPDLSVLNYRVTAIAGNFSDGEEKAIPVLTNRMMVTESLPLPVRGKGTVEFSFDKLKKSGAANGTDASLKNYKLTLEFASNPAWYAVQALPSLNDRKYENADAVFAAFWTNSLAAFIARSNPKIKAVFESWKNLTPDALQSNLAKNQQLKSALLQETPWVMQANSETSRKQKLGVFFDEDNLRKNLDENLETIKKLQSPNGGWSWFAGMPENRYVTQNILTGLGQLHHLGITNIMADPASREMVMKAIGFLDGELQRDYENLKKHQPKNPDDNHLGSGQIQYLYARSFFMSDPGLQIPDPGPLAKEAFSYYKAQAAKYWLQNDQILQGMIALALHRLGNTTVPGMILKSLSEKAVHSEETGMYWAGERGFYWYQAPIETQALMIEAYDEIAADKNTVDELKIWLLKQKQTQDWRSSRATLNACYALLLRGTDLLSEDPGVKISIGKEKINSSKLADIKKEAGTGYFQQSWSGTEITPEMGNITVSKSSDGVAWGAVYWQYFEDLDKITTAASPMKLEKKVFVARMTSSGPVLEPLSWDVGRGTSDVGASVQPFTRLLKPGDRIVVRIVLTVDRDLEYVHMKDMRASGLEPLLAASSPKQDQGPGNSLSGYRYQDGLGYYQTTTDQATNFFFDYLPKGIHVFEYSLIVNASGSYSNGITTIQCMYAPEFTAHSEGIRIKM